jgi:biopolymer transport protein ExbB/TolQ
MKKILLITAGVLTIVVLVGSLLLYLNREKIVTFRTDRALTKVEEQVLQKLQDQRAVDGAKADFLRLHARLQSGTVTTDEVQHVTEMFYSNYREGKIDSLNARGIVGEVHRLAAQ